MPYTPDPADITQPVITVDASTAAAEFRALKSFIKNRTHLSLLDPVFGVVGDDVADDSAGVQAFFNALALNPGGCGFIPKAPVRYFIGATPILAVKGNNFNLLGESPFGSAFRYTGVGAAFRNDGVTVRQYVKFCNISVKTTADNAIGMDVSYFKNGGVYYCGFDIPGNNTRGIYALGNSSLAAPYYLVLDENHIASDNYLGLTTGSIGVLFDRAIVGGQWQGPNANLISNGRISGCNESIVIMKGVGNRVLNVNSELADLNHIRFGQATAALSAIDDSGIVTAATTFELTDNTKAWTPGQFINGAVRVDDGAGGVYWRPVVTNTATKLTILWDWLNIPVAGWSYRVYASQGEFNQVTHEYIEGAASLNPNFFTAAGPVQGNSVDVKQIASLGTGKLINVDTYWPRTDSYKVGNRGMHMVPINFIATGIAAGAVEVAMTVVGEGAFTQKLLPGTWSVGAISLQASTPVLAGTLTVTAYDEAVAMPIQASLNSVKSLVDQQYVAPTVASSAFAESHRLSLKYTTSGGFLPAGTLNLAGTAWVYIP